jgi:pimeloyl-ACP methyl ester carboxylesterase
VSVTPRIVYIPGLLPKPEPVAHRAALLRCLLAGVQRLDETIAAEIAADPAAFEIVPWTYDFYGEHHDIALYTASIDAVLEQPQASQHDKDEATTLRRRLGRWLFTLGDLMPLLIPHLATERMELHLRDLRRYVRNRNNIAQHTRESLKAVLREAHAANRPILLVAHSMGSVIAFEALWQMSRSEREAMQIDLLLTMGSPLGQRFIQKRIKGHDAIGSARYPNNIRRWINLTAVGDLTAIDPALKNDFGAMLEDGLVEGIDDREIHNWFRLDGELNTHAEYGYLVNAETATIVVDWWRETRSVRDSVE